MTREECQAFFDAERARFTADTGPHACRIYSLLTEAHQRLWQEHTESRAAFNESVVTLFKLLAARDEGLTLKEKLNRFLSTTDAADQQALAIEIDAGVTALGGDATALRRSWADISAFHRDWTPGPERDFYAWVGVAFHYAYGWVRGHPLQGRDESLAPTLREACDALAQYPNKIGAWVTQLQARSSASGDAARAALVALQAELDNKFGAR